MLTINKHFHVCVARAISSSSDVMLTAVGDDPLLFLTIFCGVKQLRYAVRLKPRGQAVQDSLSLSMSASLAV